MNAATQRIAIAGAAGAIEVALDFPTASERGPRGLALIAHPHPLYAGTLDNKVVQTLARAFVALGYLAARPNFRGVGASEGTHDEGVGEVDDLLSVISHLKHAHPKRDQGLSELVLAGFSFGAFVQTHVAARLAAAGTPAERMVLVGTAVTRWNALPVPAGMHANTLLIHGEHDETVPLSDLFDWARPQQLPVVVIPGADHFFHRKLTLIKQLVLAACRDEPHENPDAIASHA